MALLLHDLGGGIAKGPGHGLECVFLAVERLGDAEIGEDEVGIGLARDIKQVFGLEI